MLMSKSRLEKFLYALYSLDSSDLPNPLSRIEELYSCLVTGEEAPTFEPISRTEKYLMTILGVYDVNELPNPISRVEVLLYKLATGDDNLDDIKSFLSEHEELLAEIIRNGGVGGNIDIEYVLYTLSTEYNTLYNTAEKPVKSAILKGNTLVNLLNKLTVNGEVGQTTNWYATTYTMGTVKSGTYILLYHVKETSGTTTRNTPGIRLADGTYLYHGYDDFNTTIGIKKWIFTANEGLSEFGYWLTDNTGKVVVEDFILLEYQEGMENWDIPYFEGMKSVQMPVLKTTGKNLFNVETVKKGYTLLSETGLESEKSTRYISDFIYVKGLTHLAITNPERTQNIWGYDENKQPIRKIKSSGVNGNFTVSIPSDITYVRMPFAKIDQSDITDEIIRNNLIQIEEGSVATEYEPYKSNILTTSEEVELRGVGEVKDELNLLTGELTQRIREVAYSNNMNIGSHSKENTFYINFSDRLTGAKGLITVDKIPYVSDWYSFLDNPNLSCSSPGNAYLYITLQNVHTTDEAKQYLSNLNPIFRYVLATESIKTVDLSVVDQDGNNTKLSTFDDLTHVTLSSEALIPEAELEVATKNEEALNTLSLEMDDISTAQTTLEKTSNTQSENVDATMIATTEIYEGLL